MSKCSQFISPAAFQHSCLVVVLLLAVKPLTSYLEIKAFRLGGDCICVYINVFRVHAYMNVFRGTHVYIYVCCWLLKAVMHFSAFTFYLPSLSLFYCVTLIFTISFRLNSMCLAGLPLLLCLTSSSLEIYVLVTDELHSWIVLLLNRPLIKVLVSCLFVGLEKSLVPHFWAVSGFFTCLGAKHTWILQTLPVFLLSHLKNIAIWWYNLCDYTKVDKESLLCNVSSMFKMCPCACSTYKLCYTSQLWIMLKNIPVTLRWEKWNSERMGKAWSAQLRDGNS